MPSDPLVFYSVGSRLYAYDYNPGHERVQDLGDWGGEITMLKFNIQGCYEESVRPWTAIKKQSMTCISRLIIPLMAVGYVS